ncbi:MAG: HTH domain-containing protein [Thermoplasmata archaeon]|nr:MAG: HTH domain-containing protein [Thermoplasmata archaeon]MCD6236785.1 HTH domain-containing protein [Thermoplasmata archaeon]
MDAEKVLEAMKEAGKPVRPGDIAKMLGVDSKEVSKAIKELKEKGEVISPKRCFYAPATNNSFSISTRR